MGSFELGALETRRVFSVSLWQKLWKRGTAMLYWLEKLSTYPMERKKKPVATKGKPKREGNKISDRMEASSPHSGLVIFSCSYDSHWKLKMHPLPGRGLETVAYLESTQSQHVQFLLLTQRSNPSARSSCLQSFHIPFSMILIPKTLPWDQNLTIRRFL